MSAPAPAMNFIEARLGGHRVAIATAAVRSALPRPERLAPLGPAGLPLQGAFDHGGQAVPLVDARALLGLPADAPCAYVLVLAHAGRLVGLAVDQVCGLLSIAPACIVQVRHDDSDDAFFRQVATGAAPADLLNVLEPERLMAWARAWAADTADAPAQDAAAAAPRRMASFDIGGRCFAVPAALVAEVIPSPATAHLAACGAFSEVTLWRGHHVCILHRHQLAPGASAGTLLAVLTLAGRQVGIWVDAIRSVWSAAGDALHPYVRMAGTHGLVQGTVDSAAGPQLLLDTDALGALAPALPPGPPADTQRAQSHGEAAYVLCQAGDVLAVPMSAIATIVARPADFAADVAAGLAPDGRMGNYLWQGRQVPVFAPGALGAPGMERDWTHLVLLERDAQWRALAVERLVGIAHARASTLVRLGRMGGAPQPVLIVDAAEHRGAYRLLEW